MGTAVRDIYVGAAAEQVWDFLQVPKNIVEWWPHCEAVRDGGPEDGGRFDFTWADKRGGIVCHEEIEQAEVVPGEGITLHLAGDICGDLHWRGRGENGGTRLTFVSDYSLPLRSLIAHISPIRLVAFEEHEADEIAASVRRHFSPTPETPSTRARPASPVTGEAICYNV
jgi:hypothetical protein